MTILDILKRRAFAEAVLRNHVRPSPVLKSVPTVAVSADFGRYVAAMAERWPSDADGVVFPSVEEARWPFPDQPSLFVWAEPISVQFLITTSGPDYHRVEPFEDEADVVAMLIIPPGLTKTPQLHVDEDGTHPLRHGRPISSSHDLQVGKVYSVHPDQPPTDEFWPWGCEILRRPGHEMAHATRFGRALVEATGHRLAALSEPTGLSRHERRAIDRTESPYRILDLSTPDRPTSDGHRNVVWSKRWMVRGHWRNQPYGTGRELRKLIWIDPFVKGPDDRPLDIRPEIFHLGQ
jgi:hypothetical protein